MRRLISLAGRAAPASRRPPRSGRWRRAVGVAAAVLVAAITLVPLGTGTTPASAWANQGPQKTCSTFPSNPTFYVVTDSTVSPAWKFVMTKAAAAWNDWAAATGVSVVTISDRTRIPEGGLTVLIDVAAASPLGKEVLATASPKCSGNQGTLVGGTIQIARDALGPKSESVQELVLAHELGHLFGVEHTTHQRSCSTIMTVTTGEHRVCGGTYPYVDDVAAVVARWQPTKVPGFPANSQIFSNRTQNALWSTYPHNSGWLNAVGFLTPGNDGYSAWTFVPDKSSDGYGWIVSTGSGLCLTENRGYWSDMYMADCDTDAGLWAIRAFGTTGAIQLVNKESQLCLSIQAGSPRADALSCEPSAAAWVKVVKPSTAPTETPLPEDAIPRDAIVGQGSSKCLAVKDGVRTVGATLTIRACGNGEEQKWKPEAVARGYLLTVYDLFPTATNDRESQTLCLVGAGSQVSLGECPVTYTADRTWTFLSTGDIRNGATGTCLNVSGAATADNSPVILYPCEAGDNSKWNVPHAMGTEDVRLVTAASSAGSAVGATAPPAGTPNPRWRTRNNSQLLDESTRWRFVPVPGTGGGLLVNGENGQCLRWQGRLVDAVLDQACDRTDSSYRWGLTAGADGLLVIQNQYTGECLDLFGESDVAATPVGTWNCTGKANQKWRSVPVPSSR